MENEKGYKPQIIQKVLRGQVWYADFHSVFDTEIIAKPRPVLVVSNDVGNYFGQTVIVLPITSRMKGSLPVHVGFSFDSLNSTILCEQIRTVPASTLRNYMYTLNDDIMMKVEEGMMIAQGIKFRIEKIHIKPEDTLKPEDTIKPENTIKFEDIKIDPNKITAGIHEALSINDNTRLPKPPLTPEEIEAREAKRRSYDGLPYPKKPRGFWTLDKMKEFVEMSFELSPEEMMELYEINTENTVKIYLIEFRVKLARNGIDLEMK